MLSKKNLRHQLKNSLPANQQHHDSLQNNALAVIQHLNIQPLVLGLYLPTEYEPKLDKIIQYALQHHIPISFPNTQQRPMRLISLSPYTQWIRNQWNLPEPTNSPECTPTLLLVPCLGFNSNHYRIGYGQGYYDEYIAQHPNLTTLGLSFSNRQCDFTPQPHDKPLNYLITENGYYKK